MIDNMDYKSETGRRNFFYNCLAEERFVKRLAKLIVVLNCTNQPDYINQ